MPVAGVREMNQPAFADLEYQGKKRKTRRELFLEQMDGLIPWQLLEEHVRPHYPNSGRGRRLYPLAVILRVHGVQLSYNLSDPGMEDLLFEAESGRRFVGLSLSEVLPDETTILKLRHFLESQGLRLREGALTWVGEEHWTAVAAAGTGNLMTADKQLVA